MIITETTIREALKEYESSTNVNPTNEVEDCVYTDIHGDHCIAGQVLNDIGLNVPNWDDEYFNNEVIRIVIRRGFFGDVEFEPEAINLLEDAQVSADACNDWGVAVKEALSVKVED